MNPLVLWGFSSYVLIWFLQAGVRVSLLGKIRIEFLVAAILAAAILFFRPERPRGEAAPRRSTFPFVVGALFLAMLVELPFSQDPNMSTTIFRDRAVKFAFMAIFISQFVRSPRGLRFFLGAFLTACAFITQESFRAALDGSMIWMNQGIPRLHGDTPLFFHPNSLAGLAIGVLPFIYFLFPVVRPRLLRLPLLGLAGTALGCLMYSGSRTAYVALMVFAVYLWSASKKKLRFLLIAAALAAAAAPVIPDSYILRFKTIFTGEDIEGHSINTRKEILRDAVEVFKRYPLGVGVAAFPAVRDRMFDRQQDTHNLYLEVATNLGIQGLIVFAVFILKMLGSFRDSVKSYARQIARLEPLSQGSGPPELLEHLENLRLLRATGLAAAGYIIIRLALGLFGMDMYEIYWWIGTGLAISLFNIDQFARRVTDRLAGPEPEAKRSTSLAAGFRPAPAVAVWKALPH